tara:strand:- start:164 stop:1012 length:849 start_codon:yes stop_codon:yes gene_type:complete
MAQRVVDPFKVLGVPPTATLEEAQRAFHDKAMQNHPDSNHGSEAHERMQAVNVAWDSVRAAILARVDTPEPRTTAAARQQRQPSQERDAASRRAAELVAAAERRMAAERMAAERKAVDQAKFKEALAKDKANKAKAKMAREKLKQSKAEAAKDAKDAKAKRVAEAAVAARLAELEREAVLIENASDDVQAKVAAKRGWLAYYAHLWLIRSLREEALSAPPLSAFRKTYLSLIAAFEDDLCTDRDIFYLAALNTGGRAGRAIFGIPFHWNVQVVQGPGRPGPS